MASTGSKTVPITGLTDKRNIMLTISITLSGKFLPMQVIYAGKTKASQPRGFVFPKKFCSSQNEKHWSNEPYIIQEKENLGLPPQQRALIIWDVFKGQTTEAVRNKLESLMIEQVEVPATISFYH